MGYVVQRCPFYDDEDGELLGPFSNVEEAVAAKKQIEAAFSESHDKFAVVELIQDVSAWIAKTQAEEEELDKWLASIEKSKRRQQAFT